MALELSYVNSSLQLLKEELEELNGSAEVDRPKGCVCACAGPVGVGEDVVRTRETPSRAAPECCAVCVRDSDQNRERGLRVPGEVRGGRWARQGPALESGLNGSGSSEGVSVPMIPLGLKETKELDWSTPLRVSADL